MADYRRSFHGIIVLGRGKKILFLDREAKKIIAGIQGDKKPLSRIGERRLTDQLNLVRSKALENCSPHPQNPGLASPSQTVTVCGTRFFCRGIPLKEEGVNRGLVIILIETVTENGGTLIREHSADARLGRGAKIVVGRKNRKR
jgi:hypothetical protein